MSGEHLALESAGCLIRSQKLVATIGMHDLVVVETDDAILICPRNQAQKVRDLVNILKKLEREGVSLTRMKLYPLHLQRHLDDRLWGGDRLVRFLDLTPPYPERIAESWQVYDDNLILNGPLAGQTLAEVTREYRDRLVGSLSIPRYGADFPLLAKFIDARQDLSIQVHPDDDYAHSVEAATGFHGKSEAWYILEADPGASLYYHLAPAGQSLRIRGRRPRPNPDQFCSTSSQ